MTHYHYLTGQPCNCGFNKDLHLGSRRIAEFSEPEALPMEIPVPPSLYHVAPTFERGRIQTHGLIPSRPGSNPRYQDPNIKGFDFSKQPEGVYLSTTPEGNRIGLPDTPVDIWKVDPSYIKSLLVDPHGPSQWRIAPHAIPAEALSLHQPAEQDLEGPHQKFERFLEKYRSPAQERKEWENFEPDPEWKIGLQSSQKRPKFSSVESSIGKISLIHLPWEPGLPGKAIYYPNSDRLVSWADPRHHSEVWQENPEGGYSLYIEPEGNLYLDRDMPFINGPSGNKEIGKDELRSSIHRLDPRLIPETNYQWHFGGPTIPAEITYGLPSPMRPGLQGPAGEVNLSPYQNKTWQINVGTDSPEHIQQWILQRFPDVPMQIVPALGGWAGQAEPSTAIVLYNTPQHLMREIVRQYGEDHPNEQALAVIPRDEQSTLFMNPGYGGGPSAAAEGGVGGPEGLDSGRPEVVQAGLWSLSSLKGSPGGQIAPSPGNEQDPLIAFHSGSLSDSSIRCSHVLEWEPGKWGKGLIDRGEVHTWNTVAEDANSEEDGYPTHPEYAAENFPYNDWTKEPSWENAFSIDPHGRVNLYEDKPELGFAIERADPRLKVNLGWDFGSTEPYEEAKGPAWNMPNGETEFHDVQFSGDKPGVPTVDA